MVGSVGVGLYSPLDAVVPFTYRDNATYLSILNGALEKLDEVVAQLNLLTVQSNDNLNNGLGGLRAELLAAISALRTEMVNLIEGSHDESIAFDPTNGTHLEGLSTVVSRVYDNLRIYAYFAKQYDNLGLTAAQYDALQYPARHFDLAVLHPTLNDIWNG